MLTLIRFMVRKTYQKLCRNKQTNVRSVAAHLTGKTKIVSYCVQFQYHPIPGYWSDCNCDYWRRHFKLMESQNA